jgi:hypothetical protein
MVRLWETSNECSILVVKPAVELFPSVRTLESFVGPWPFFQFLDPVHSR